MSPTSLPAISLTPLPGPYWYVGVCGHGLCTLSFKKLFWGPFTKCSVLIAWSTGQPCYQTHGGTLSAKPSGLSTPLAQWSVSIVFSVLQPCQQFCNRVREVCGDEIRGLSGFTNLLREVKVNFMCGGLPQPDAGSAPECYEQRGVAAVAAVQEPRKWQYQVTSVPQYNDHFGT